MTIYEVWRHSYKNFRLIQIFFISVGAPMEVKRNLEPTAEEIDAVHAEFTERLKTLFETEKVKHLKYHEEAKLVIT